MNNGHQVFGAEAPSDIRNAFWHEVDDGALYVSKQYISPRIAREILKRNHPDQRRVSARDVVAIRHDMANDAWKPTHQGICYDGNFNLIDGQTRLGAVAGLDADCEVEFIVFVNVHGSVRDPMDTHRARTVAYITGTQTRDIGAANILRSLEAGKSITERLTPHMAQELMNKYSVEREALQGSVPCSSNLTGGVRAACIWCWPIDQKTVRNFARSVITGEMLKSGDPAYAYRQWADRINRPYGWDQACAAIYCIGSALRSKRVDRVLIKSPVYMTEIAHMRTDLGLVAPDFDEQEEAAAE